MEIEAITVVQVWCDEQLFDCWSMVQSFVWQRLNDFDHDDQQREAKQKSASLIWNDRFMYQPFRKPYIFKSHNIWFKTLFGPCFNLLHGVNNAVEKDGAMTPILIYMVCSPWVGWADERPKSILLAHLHFDPRLLEIPTPMSRHVKEKKYRAGREILLATDVEELKIEKDFDQVFLGCQIIMQQQHSHWMFEKWFVQCVSLHTNLAPRSFTKYPATDADHKVESPHPINVLCVGSFYVQKVHDKGDLKAGTQVMMNIIHTSKNLQCMLSLIFISHV